MEKIESQNKLKKIKSYELSNTDHVSCIFVDENGDSHFGKWQLTSAFDDEPTMQDIKERMINQQKTASHYVVEKTEDGRWLVGYFLVSQSGGSS